METKQKRKRRSTPRNLSLNSSPKKRQVKKRKRVKPQDTSFLETFFKSKAVPDLAKVRALKVGQLRMVGKELKLELPLKMKKEDLQNRIITSLESSRNWKQRWRNRAGKDEPVPWSPPKGTSNSSPVRIVNEYPEKGVRVRKLPLSKNYFKKNISMMEQDANKPLTGSSIQGCQIYSPRLKKQTHSSPKGSSHKNLDRCKDQAEVSSCQRENSNIMSQSPIRASNNDLSESGHNSKLSHGSKTRIIREAHCKEFKCDLGKANFAKEVSNKSLKADLIAEIKILREKVQDLRSDLKWSEGQRKFMEEKIGSM